MYIELKMTQIWPVSGPQKIFSLMYTKEQLKVLENKLKQLEAYEEKFQALQNLNNLTIDIYSKNSGRFCDIPISTKSRKAIYELLINDYAGIIKYLRNEIENTTIINPSKL